MNERKQELGKQNHCKSEMQNKKENKIFILSEPKRKNITYSMAEESRTIVATFDDDDDDVSVRARYAGS